MPDGRMTERHKYAAYLFFAIGLCHAFAVHGLAAHCSPTHHTSALRFFFGGWETQRKEWEGGVLQRCLTRRRALPCLRQRRECSSVTVFLCGLWSESMEKQIANQRADHDIRESDLESQLSEAKRHIAGLMEELCAQKVVAEGLANTTVLDLQRAKEEIAGLKPQLETVEASLSAERAMGLEKLQA